MPMVQPADGIFGPVPSGSPRFQEIFSLTPDGIVGNATWYRLVYLYVGIRDLAELVSEGQTFYSVSLKDLAEGLSILLSEAKTTV